MIYRSRRRVRVISAGRLSVLGLSALLAGCGGEKLTTHETEQLIAERSPTIRSVNCVDGPDDWDYECTYESVHEGRVMSSFIYVKVDGEGITAQTAP